MKKILLSTLVVLSTVLAKAGTINSENVTVSAANVDQVIRLVDKSEGGSSHKKLSIIVTDRGMSTDVSPRYTITLGYASMAEMGNITASFRITDQVFQFLSATRISAGVYEVKTVDYRDEGFVVVTTTIDATKMFADEKKARQACGGDFCDQILKTSVQVSEKVKKQ